MFRTDLMSNIRSPNTVFTARGICQTPKENCIKPKQQYGITKYAENKLTPKLYIKINGSSMTNTSCCEYSILTPDDGQ